MHVGAHVLNPTQAIAQLMTLVQTQGGVVPDNLKSALSSVLVDNNVAASVKETPKAEPADAVSQPKRPSENSPEAASKRAKVEEEPW